MDDTTKKVLAETWSATNRVVVDDGPRCGSRMASGIDLHSSTPEEAEASIVHIRLAACAPEALRMLLEAEWSGWTYDQEYDVDETSMCPWCSRPKPYLPGMRGYGGPDGHAPDCRWLALMKKAGLR